MFGRKARRIEQLERRLQIRERILCDAVARLYLMTQDGKRLLLTYKRQSTLTKTERTALKLRTNAYLRRSSSAILRDVYAEDE